MAQSDQLLCSSQQLLPLVGLRRFQHLGEKLLQHEADERTARQSHLQEIGSVHRQIREAEWRAAQELGVHPPPRKGQRTGTLSVLRRAAIGKVEPEQIASVLHAYFVQPAGWTSGR